jgi:hypothetical protein
VSLPIAVTADIDANGNITLHVSSSGEPDNYVAAVLRLNGVRQVPAALPWILEWETSKYASPAIGAGLTAARIPLARVHLPTEVAAPGEIAVVFKTQEGPRETTVPVPPDGQINLQVVVRFISEARKGGKSLTLQILTSLRTGASHLSVVDEPT